MEFDEDFWSFERILNKFREKKLPINGDDLWPSNILLQIQRFSDGLGLNSVVRKRPILILERDKFTIATQKKPDPDLPYPTLDDNSGFRFYQGSLSNEYCIDVNRIGQVIIGVSGISGITIKERDEKGKLKKIFRSQAYGTPLIFFEIVKTALEIGILEKPQKKWWGIRDYKKILSEQIFRREVKRQIQRVSQGAEIILKGEQISEDDFKRIIS